MNYNQAVRKLGVHGHDMFDTADLYEGKNFNMVLTHLNALAHLCETLPGYKGPTIEDTSQAKNLYGDSLLGKLTLSVFTNVRERNNYRRRLSRHVFYRGTSDH